MPVPIAFPVSWFLGQTFTCVCVCGAQAATGQCPFRKAVPQSLGLLTAALEGAGWRALSGGRAGILCPCPTPAPTSRQVNDTPFRNLTREEAVQFLLELPPGEEVELVTQRKQDSECV